MPYRIYPLQGCIAFLCKIWYNCNMNNEPLIYPVRINRYLAHKGLATRRGADELIEKKLITINGTVAKLGDKINEKDVVIVAPSVLASISKQYRYIAYHKPCGVSTDVQPGSQSISS